MGYVSCFLIAFFVYHWHKLSNGIYIELNIEFMSEVTIALLLYIPFSLTGALQACWVFEQKDRDVQWAGHCSGEGYGHS